MGGFSEVCGCRIDSNSLSTNPFWDGIVWYRSTRAVSKLIGEIDIVTNAAEEKVSNFYNTVGWEKEDGIAEDTKRWEDLRENAKEYSVKTRSRVLRHIPKSGKNILDMGSGPIPYKEYLEISRNFKKRYCVDLSSKALNDAEKKIGNHGVFLHGSIFDIKLEEDFFDCTVCQHVIYHIDENKQDEAVRKLLATTKPGRPLIIVYRNPHAMMEYFALPFRLIRETKTLFRKKDKSPDLYYFSHPISWWDRFRDMADIRILPWRSFYSTHQKALIPNNKIGKKMFDFLFELEERYPNTFVKYFSYYMVILTKKNKQAATT